MADMEVIKYEAAIEKLCADWVVDVSKAMKREHDAIEQRTVQLRQQIVALPFPTESDPAEIKNLPSKINEIFRDENQDLKDMVFVDLTAFVNEAGDKLTINGHMMLGYIGDLSL